VIVRVSSIAVPESNLDKYLEHVKENELPGYEVAPGLISVWLLRRPFVAYVEVMILSLWQSDEALTGFIESQTEPIGLRSDYGVIHMEPHAYELVVSREGRFRLAGKQQE
jgi:heme-degrading monooxygenase HmoA